MKRNRNRLAALTMALCLSAASTPAISQNSSGAQPCAAPEFRQFDFWLGEWDLTWPAEQWGGRRGEFGHGANTVTTILDSCVVHESFRFPAQKYNGNSVSTYSKKRGIWQQTWVDNSGGYLIFTGKFKNGKMELRTPPRKQDDKTSISRMVFRNITPNSLDWDWQRSDDAGQSWKNIWNIHYQRKGQ